MEALGTSLLTTSHREPQSIVKLSKSSLPINHDQENILNRQAVSRNISVHHNEARSVLTDINTVSDQPKVIKNSVRFSLPSPVSENHDITTNTQETKYPTIQDIDSINQSSDEDIDMPTTALAGRTPFSKQVKENKNSDHQILARDPIFNYNFGLDSSPTKTKANHNSTSNILDRNISESINTGFFDESQILSTIQMSTAFHDKALLAQHEPPSPTRTASNQRVAVEMLAVYWSPPAHSNSHSESKIYQNLPSIVSNTPPNAECIQSTETENNTYLDNYFHDGMNSSPMIQTSVNTTSNSFSKSVEVGIHSHSVVREHEQEACQQHSDPNESNVSTTAAAILTISFAPPTDSSDAHAPLEVSHLSTTTTNTAIVATTIPSIDHTVGVSLSKPGITRSYVPRMPQPTEPSPTPLINNPSSLQITSATASHVPRLFVVNPITTSAATSTSAVAATKTITPQLQLLYNESEKAKPSTKVHSTIADVSAITTIACIPSDTTYQIMDETQANIQGVDRTYEQESNCVDAETQTVPSPSTVPLSLALTQTRQKQEDSHINLSLTVLPGDRSGCTLPSIENTPARHTLTDTSASVHNRMQPIVATSDSQKMSKPTTNANKRKSQINNFNINSFDFSDSDSDIKSEDNQLRGLAEVLSLTPNGNNIRIPPIAYSVTIPRHKVSTPFLEKFGGPLRYLAGKIQQHFDSDDDEVDDDDDFRGFNGTNDCDRSLFTSDESTVHTTDWQIDGLPKVGDGACKLSTCAIGNHSDSAGLGFLRRSFFQSVETPRSDRTQELRGRFNFDAGYLHESFFVTDFDSEDNESFNVNVKAINKSVKQGAVGVTSQSSIPTSVHRQLAEANDVNAPILKVTNRRYESKPESNVLLPKPSISQHQSHITTDLNTSIFEDFTLMTDITTLTLDPTSTTSNTKETCREIDIAKAPRLALAGRRPVELNVPDMKEIVMRTIIGGTAHTSLVFCNQRKRKLRIRPHTLFTRFEPSREVQNMITGSNARTAVIDEETYNHIPNSFLVDSKFVELSPGQEMNLAITFAPCSNLPGVYSGVLKIVTCQKAFVILLRGIVAGPVRKCEVELTDYSSCAPLTSKTIPIPNTESNKMPPVAPSNQPLSHDAMTIVSEARNSDSNHGGVTEERKEHYVRPALKGKQESIRSMLGRLKAISLVANNADTSPETLLQKVSEEVSRAKLQEMRNANQAASRAKLNKHCESTQPQPQANPVAISSSVPATTTAPTWAAVHNNSSRGLFFRRTVVSFGSVEVGSLTRVRIELCNSTDQQVTVYIGDPKLPFVLLHNEVVIRPRCYVRVPVRFVPVGSGNQYSSELVAQTVGGEYQTKVSLVGSSY